MGKAKRFLAGFLATALTITSVNMGSIVSVRAAEEKAPQYYQKVKGTLDGSGNQSSDQGYTNYATIAGTGEKTTTGTNVLAPFVDGKANGGSMFGSARIGCAQFTLPADMTLTGDYSATVTLHLLAVNNVDNSKGEYTSVALYQTANPDEVTASDAATYEAVDPDIDDTETNAYSYPIWSDVTVAKKSSNTDLTNYTLNFDVTDAVKQAYADGKTKLVLRAQVPVAGVWVHDEGADAALQPELTIDATTQTSLTVKYVNAEGEELKTAQTIPVCVGSKYTYEVEDEEQIIKTEDGKVYVCNTENSTLSVTVSEGNNVITVSYVEASIARQAEEVNIETRAGYAPKLPEKVKAEYTSGLVSEEPVVWDEISEEQYATAGTSFEAAGKFEGTDIEVKAAVTVTALEDYLLAKYSFDEETLTDSAGKKAAAEKVDTVETVTGLSGNAVSIPGGSKTAGAIKLPDDLLQADGVTQDDFTVSMFVKRKSQGNSFAMVLHASDVQKLNPAAHIGLINKDTLLNVEYRNNGGTQKTVDAARPTNVDEWTHIAIVTKGSTGEAWLYVNGEQAAYADGITVKASDLAAQNNYLGRASWPDNDYAAAYDEFSVYSTALEPEEIKEICDATLYEAQVAKTKEALKITYKDEELTFDPSAVTADLKLPATGEEAGAGMGTVITWESGNTDVITNDGAVYRPSVDEADAKVTLTAAIRAGGCTETKEFTVTVKKMDGVNFTALKAAIADAAAKYQKACRENAYTAVSLKVWKDAIDAAQAVADQENVEGSTVTTDDVKNAVTALNTEMKKELALKDFEELNQDLTAWYPLTSDASDASGNDHDGTATGVTFTRDMGAQFTGAGAFSSYIDLPTEIFQGKDQLTISLWAFDEGGSKSNVFGFSNSDKAGEAKHFYINTSDPKGYFRVMSNTKGWSETSGFSGEKEELAFAANTWGQIAAVIDGTNLTIYKDGELIDSTTVSQSVSDMGEIVMAAIGTCVYGKNGDKDYKGYVKDFRVYDAVLAADQVKEVYDYMGTLPMTYAKEDLIKALGASADEDGTVSLNVTEETLTLPRTGTQGETIDWTADDSGNITVAPAEEEAETVSAAVSLPEDVVTTKTAVLTATIRLGDETAEVAVHCSIYKRSDVDTSELDTLVDDIEKLKLKETDYTTSTWKIFADALTAAKAQIARPTSEDDVAAAATNLQSAKDGLDKRADMKALNAAIESAKALSKEDYTEDTWSAFEEALDAAEALAAKAADTPESAQSTVDEAKQTLVDAQGALKTKAEQEEEQKREDAENTANTAITEIQNKLAELKQEDYTETSWKAVEDAIKAVQDMIGNPEASAEDITKAKEVMEAAFGGLEKKETPAPGGDDNPGGNENPGGNNNSGGNQTGDTTQNPNGGQQQTEVKVSSIKIVGKNLKIAAGKKVSLKLEIAPENAANKGIVWESSNTKYATVNSKGVVTTKKAGAGKSVTITAKAADGSGVQARIKVTIMKNAVTKLSLKANSKTVKAGKKITVKATVKTNGKKVNKTLEWTSSNTKYATVNSKGVVTAKKAGAGKTVKITAKSTDGTNKKATIKIKITK